MFDRNFVPLLTQSGFKRITTNAREYGQDGPHDLLKPDQPLVIKEAGYVYIYLSNDNETAVEVFFDDFTVEHIKSPVVQMDDYYPFGLAFNSYSRENSVDQKFKFQGQEHIDDLGLNWDSFKWRNHQPDIGRFFNIDPLAEKYVYNSPYAFSENHVVAHRELEGLEKVLAIFFHGGVEGGGKQTTPEKSGGAGEIYNYTQKNAESKNLEFKGIIVAPGADTDDGVETATNFFNENYQEGDKVIVYGYSYGGDGAVEFSKGLNEQDKPVHLLVTVDSSDGLVGLGMNATVDTDVPQNVGLNLNLYQNEPAGTTRANGEPNTAQNKEKTKVVNMDVSGSTTTHGNIQQKNQSTIQTVINSVINY